MAESMTMRASSTSVAGSGYWQRGLPPPKSAIRAPLPNGRKHGRHRQKTGRCVDLICGRVRLRQGNARYRISVSRVALNVGDARGVTLPACDVVVMLDVLHYMDRGAQQVLLKSAHQALAPGGVLLLRVGDITSNWRSRFTSMVDWWVTLLRDKRWPRLHCRSLAEWKLLLESIGYSAVAQPMSEGTPFANVLLIATKHR